MAQQVDVAVLGAGPGGYVAAIRAAQLGLKVAVIEKEYWGGVCLNIGCVPAKALLRNAEIANLYTREAAVHGIKGEVTFDYGVAYDRSRNVADGRAKGVHFLMRKNGIAELTGSGTFTGPRSLSVGQADGSTEEITFSNAIIATGSTVRMLPGVHLSTNVITYKELILSRDLPASIVIVGAGPIGLEFAYVLANYGTTVTVVEYADRVLPTEDSEVSKEVQRNFRKLGVKLITSARVDYVRDSGGEATVSYADLKGERKTITASKAMISIGFAANVNGYGLENTGVTLSDRQGIDIDDMMRTNVNGIYAIGDVTAKMQLAHVAEAQGIIAAETIAGAETMSLGDYRMMPRATFIQPQVASFGLTEAQARDEGFAVKVAKFPFTANAKANSLGETGGFVKLIADATHGELLGAHIVGQDASELLPELTLAQKWDLTATELARNVHVHPSLSEALQDGFHGLLDHMINL